MLNTLITFNDRVRSIQLPQPGSIPSGAGTYAGWPGIGISANILQRAAFVTMPFADCRNAVDSLNVGVTLNENVQFCTGPLTGALAICNGNLNIHI